MKQFFLIIVTVVLVKADILTSDIGLKIQSRSSRPIFLTSRQPYRTNAAYTADITKSSAYLRQSSNQSRSLSGLSTNTPDLGYESFTLLPRADAREASKSPQARPSKSIDRSLRQGNESPDKTVHQSKLPAPELKRIPVEVHAQLKGPSSIVIMEGNNILGATVHYAQKGEIINRELSHDQKLWTSVETGAGGSARVEAIGRKSRTATIGKSDGKAQSRLMTYIPNTGVKRSQSGSPEGRVSKVSTNSPSSRAYLLSEIEGEGTMQIATSSSPPDSPLDSPGRQPSNHPLFSLTHGSQPPRI